MGEREIWDKSLAHVITTTNKILSELYMLKGGGAWVREKTQKSQFLTQR